MNRSELITVALQTADMVRAYYLAHSGDTDTARALIQSAALCPLAYWDIPEFSNAYAAACSALHACSVEERTARGASMVDVDMLDIIATAI